MENKISIEQVLDNNENNLVYKSKPSVLVSILLIVAGILLIAINKIVATSPGSMLPSLFIVAGIILLIWGIIYIFFTKSKYKLTQNKKVIKFSEVLFDIKERDRLINSINEGNMQELEKLKTARIDTLKLRIAATEDGSFCYTQVATYVPYEFININDVHKHSLEEAKGILNLLKNNK